VELAAVDAGRLRDHRLDGGVCLGQGDHGARRRGDDARLLGGDGGQAVAERAQVLPEDRRDGDHPWGDQGNLVGGPAHARLEHHGIALPVAEEAQGAQGEEAGRRQVAVIREIGADPGQRGGHLGDQGRVRGE
jgi:hypothetical protein